MLLVEQNARQALRIAQPGLRAGEGARDRVGTGGRLLARIRTLWKPIWVKDVNEEDRT